ncbi:uncharacterized protein BCR38DRAFT_487965 [Pseudomassariella vexata]|uniref:Uncharacterized protein n=1 Tax=Pseudomassariella vexata TaxID=1141098 RepID=A0A1Y2DNQ9_9PEZI|nr:uncharacterized protein BCR38DRAFT_487965 [Pseudomassariella vexata]ORY60912.1 hypothetical protein BCR38DRAFT_487965 [Pseudomassariella vexata]
MAKARLNTPQPGRYSDGATHNDGNETENIPSSPSSKSKSPERKIYPRAGTFRSPCGYATGSTFLGMDNNFAGTGSQLPIFMYHADLKFDEPPNIVVQRKIHLAVYGRIRQHLNQGNMLEDLWELEPIKIVAMPGPGDVPLAWTFKESQRMQQMCKKVEEYTARLGKVKQTRGKLSGELMLFLREFNIDTTLADEIPEQWADFCSTENLQRLNTGEECLQSIPLRSVLQTFEILLAQYKAEQKLACAKPTCKKGRMLDEKEKSDENAIVSKRKGVRTDDARKQC